MQLKPKPCCTRRSAFRTNSRMDVMHTPTCTLCPVAGEGGFVRSAKRNTILGHILTKEVLERFVWYTRYKSRNQANFGKE